MKVMTCVPGEAGSGMKMSWQDADSGVPLGSQKEREWIGQEGAMSCSDVWMGSSDSMRSPEIGVTLYRVVPR